MRRDGHKSRCTLTDTIPDCIVAMSDGNPGALTVLMESVKQSPAIDPDAAFPIGVMLSLDDIGLYGPQIWILYKDVCGSSMVNLCALLRADQLGQLAGVTDSLICQVVASIEHGRGRSTFDMEAIVKAVQERLPKFGTHEDMAEQMRSDAANCHEPLDPEGI